MTQDLELFEALVNAVQCGKCRVCTKPRSNPFKAWGHCPIHPDERPSLHLEWRNGRILLICRSAGCSNDAIIEWCKEHNLWNGTGPAEPRPHAKAGPKQPHVEPDLVYDYTDASGILLFQVCRWLDPKRFAIRRPDPKKPGGWVWDSKGVPDVPYRLPELLATIAQNDLVLFVEGEKDADACCRIGLHASTNRGGADAWKPELAQFFEGGMVGVMRDNDEAGLRLQRNVADSLYGRAVWLRCLAPPPEYKDISEWIDAGATADDIIKTTTGAEDYEPSWIPEVTREGDDFTARCPRLGVTVALTNLEYDHGDLRSWLRVDWRFAAGGLPLRMQAFNLMAAETRDRLIKALDQRASSVPWDPLINRIIQDVLAQYTRGEPAELLEPKPKPTEDTLIDYLVIRDNVSMLWADGDAGKSVFALWLAVASRLGKPGIGAFRIRQPIRWLYLDWERSKTFHEDRLWRMMNGFGAKLEPIDGLIYRHMTRPLLSSIGAVKSDIDREKIDVVVIDAAGMAGGFEPMEAGTVMKLIGALRGLRTTGLILHHVTREQISSGHELDPYGSVYYKNELLNGWSLEKTLGTQDHEILLTHRKHNDAAPQAPFGAQVVWTANSIQVRPATIREMPQYQQRRTTMERITDALTSASEKLSAAQIYAKLAEDGGRDVSLDSVKKAVERLRMDKRLVADQREEVGEDGRPRNIWVYGAAANDV